MARLLLIGASGQGKVVADIIENSGEHTVLGFIDTYKAAGTEVFGYPLLGAEQRLPELIGELGVEAAIVTIGENWLRKEVAERIAQRAPSLHFATAIHPSAVLGRGVTLGRGTVVMANAVINADTAVGDFCIINTKASVDHDSSLGAFTHVSPGVSTGGNVRTGEGAMIGAGAVIIHGVSIGEWSVIGAGAVVVRDIPSLSLAYGSPATVKRAREKDEKVL